MRSERLIQKLNIGHRGLLSAAHHLWDTPQARLTYPIYLCHMHMVVRSGVRLMETAIAECAKLTDDEVAQRLSQYWQKHKEEERGHDEWLLQDLAETGHDPEDALAQTPPPCIANLVGAQYYWILHHHPVALLGHMAALEIYHPPQGFAQYLSHKTNYPISAFRAIARHEKLDLAHSQDIIELINALPLTESQERLVGISGLHTMGVAAEVLARIAKESQKSLHQIQSTA